MKPKWEQKQPEFVNRINKINGMVQEIVVELAKREHKKLETLVKMQEMMSRNQENNKGKDK